MMEPTRERLMTQISAFCKRTGMSRREFGLRATGNASFWSRLAGLSRDGVSLNLKTIERAEAFMRAYVDDRYIDCEDANEEISFHR